MVGEDSLIVLLHGIAARGIDLHNTRAGLTAAFAEAILAAPDAPEPLSDNPDLFQWYSHEGITRENRPGRVAAARLGFDAVVRSEIETHGFQGKLHRVALVGFSQGAIMALDAVASGRWPVAGVVGFCARFATPEPYHPATDVPVLVIQGAADPVIPEWEGEHAEACLRAAGCEVSRHVLPGVGHAVNAQGTDLAASFLEDSFRRAAGRSPRF